MLIHHPIHVSSRRAALGLLALGLCAAQTVWGQTPPARAAKPAPPAPVVLSITDAAKGTSVHFDMAALEHLPQVSFTTRTPWYEKPTQFTGPLLRDVLAAAQVQGQTLVAVALNDYKVDMPLDDTVRRGAIVAVRVNGQPMAVRDKGPLFVVFPFDTSADLHTERYYNRSIWQLRWLRVQ